MVAYQHRRRTFGPSADYMWVPREHLSDRMIGDDASRQEPRAGFTMPVMGGDTAGLVVALLGPVEIGQAGEARAARR
jgi:hypothetical protein